MTGNFLNRVKTFFITGLAVILPIFLTIIILKWLIGKISVWFLEPFVRLVRPYIGSLFIIFLLKLALFFIILIVIILCGAATRVIFVRRFFGWGERLFIRMPLISKIYIAIKEISAALFGKEKGLFKRVVLIEYPRQGVYSLAFVTREHVDKGFIKKEIDDDLASVFVPTAPTPMSGFFVFARKKELIDVNMSVEEAVKIILSGGAISPYNKGQDAKSNDT